MTVSRSTFSFLAIVLVYASLSQCAAQEGAAVPKGSTPAPPAAVGATDLQTAVTATKKEDQDIGNAVALLQDITKYTSAIKNITVPAMRSTAPDLEDLQNLQAIVIGIQRAKLVERASTAKGLLESEGSTSDDAKRNAACAPLPQDPTGQPREVTSAVANCTRVEKDAQARFNDLGTALGTLTETVATIPAFVKKIDSTQDKLKPFSKLTTKKDGTSIDPDSTTLLQVLPNGLPALRQVLERCVGNRAAWDGMKTSLGTTTDKDALTKLEASITATNTAFETLQNTINELLPKLEKWFQSIQSAELAAAKTLDGQISEVQSDPAKNSATAVGAVREQGDTLASAQAVVDAWPPLVGFLADGEPSDFKLPTTKQRFEDLKKETNVLRGSVARMHDALAVPPAPCWTTHFACDLPTRSFPTCSSVPPRISSTIWRKSFPA
jgi:hypothetical protein